MSARDDIIRVAKSYIGAKGGSIAHRYIIHIFNSVKPQGYSAKTTDPWCSEFVTACAIQAFGKKTAVKYFPLSAGCPMVISRAKTLGIWVENDAYVPKKGDWILYDWDDNRTGSGDNKNSPDHVGIVESATKTEITVIEGNYGDMVKRRKIPVNGRYIRGFVAPHYELINKKIDTKPTDEIVKEVFSGEWGNGIKRKQALTNAGYDYDVIQKRINQVVDLTDRVMAGEFGNGAKRKKLLGKDYDIVQWNINRIYG